VEKGVTTKKRTKVSFGATVMPPLQQLAVVDEKAFYQVKQH